MIEYIEKNNKNKRMSEIKHKILIIDTDQFILNNLTSKLADENTEITSTDQTGKAVELIEKEAFQIIILEIILPLFSGFPLLNVIEKSSKNKNAAVVVFSNLQQESDIKKILKHEITDYILKYNTDLDNVAETIKKIIEKKQKPLSAEEKTKLAAQIESLNTANQQESKHQSSILKCSKCEAILPPGTEFCPYCGTRVESKDILQQKY